MKKIIFILLVFSLLILLGCGKTEDITGNVVKDTIDGSQDSKELDSAKPSTIQDILISERCSFEEFGINPVFSCESSIIDKDKITLKLKSNRDNYRMPERIYLPNIGLNGCELNIEPSVENSMKYEDVKTFEIPCDIDREFVDTKLILEYVEYKPTNNLDGQMKDSSGQSYYVHYGKIEGYLNRMVK